MDLNIIHSNAYTSFCLDKNHDGTIMYKTCNNLTIIIFIIGIF
jgi:hypothetical protein